MSSSGGDGDSSSAPGFSLEGIDDVQDFPWVNEGEGPSMSWERYSHLHDLMHTGNKAFRENRLDQAPLLYLECLENYIAEVSLIEYNMLCFVPSLIAASSIFLAKFILVPSKKPWVSKLHECVLALHGLCCNTQNSNLPAIREKYSQHTGLIRFWWRR